MAKKSKFSKEQYLSWYESMLLMRKFEEKLSQLYIQRKFGGFLHLYIGQEAVVAGAVSATTIDDKMITAYRCHAHPLGRGTDPKYMMAELYGKTTGLSKGKGGSMHMFDVSKNVFGGHGIVGGQIPLGTGLAFADKYKGNNFVTMCSMGDGAVRQGALHEAFNMAMTWKIPVIYIIENNKYAMGTSVERTSNVTDLYKLGLSYDMPGEPVDAMNVEDVHNAIAKAAKHCREGKGPYLLEMITYRFKGHSMSDPRKYRTKEEEAEYQNEDPIEKVLVTIRENKYATEKQIEAIGAKIKKQIEDAIKFAEESPLPEPDDMYEDIYAEPNYPFIKD
ncbi:MAG: pyruvate dehydrogenase (acetyl-transferring) E1 component subunit alpha [Flavobacteriales bacterium]|nr:pyruvate dehydrogenase (acetyl-transferring) E1 component subunit alpha [Flavobacteriales bacterium]MCB9364050.1 pyruvate dehydrogenase (acetyl-transferring) E1 component subunit alpha [Flavobacteriales bacterium]